MVTDSIWGAKVFFSIYFAEELSLKPITNWVIADLANKEGRALVKAALQQMVRIGVDSYSSELLSNKARFSIFRLKEATCNYESLRFFHM